MTYVGELGWELIVPSEFAVGRLRGIAQAGRDLGSSLRLLRSRGAPASRKALRLEPRTDA